MEYHVIWRIDVEADSPEAAAQKAFALVRNTDTTATVFEVVDAKGATTQVDVGEL